MRRQRAQIFFNARLIAAFVGFQFLNNGYEKSILRA
jgi:hypothetical protein